MNYKQLKDCVEYAILHAEVNHIAILDDATCKGFDSEEYELYQMGELLKLLDDVKLLGANAAASKAFQEHVDSALKITRR